MMIRLVPVSCLPRGIGNLHRPIITESNPGGCLGFQFQIQRVGPAR